MKRPSPLLAMKQCQPGREPLRHPGTLGSRTAKILEEPDAELFRDVGRDGGEERALGVDLGDFGPFHRRAM
jgi:hypothetical protein